MVCAELRTTSIDIIGENSNQPEAAAGTPPGNTPSRRESLKQHRTQHRPDKSSIGRAGLRGPGERVRASTWHAETT